MRFWQTTVVLLLCLFGLFVSASLSVEHPVADNQEHVTHEDGSPCPDSEQDSEPCGPLCPCTCCPGHAAMAAAVVPVPVAFSFVAPSLPRAQQVGVRLPKALHPQELLYSIFHPPRV